MSNSQFVKSHKNVQAKNFTANCLLPLASGCIVLGGWKCIDSLYDYRGHLEIWDPATMQCVAAKSLDSQFVWYLAPLPADLTDPETPRFASFEQRGNNAIYRFHDATLLVSSRPAFFPVSGVPGFIFQCDPKLDTKLKFQWRFGEYVHEHIRYIMPEEMQSVFARYDEGRSQYCTGRRCNTLLPNLTITINSTSQFFSLSPDGKYQIAVHKRCMILSRRDEKSRVFNIENSNYLRLIQGKTCQDLMYIPDTDYNCGDFFPDSEYFALAITNKLHRLIVASVSKLSRFIVNVDSQIYAIATIPDRYHEVITSHCDGSVRLYDFLGISERLVDQEHECKSTTMQPASFLMPARKTGSLFSNVQRNLAIVSDNERGQTTLVCMRRDENRIDFLALISYVDILNQLLVAYPGMNRGLANLCANYTGFHAGFFSPKNKIGLMETPNVSLTCSTKINASPASP